MKTALISHIILRSFNNVVRAQKLAYCAQTRNHKLNVLPSIFCAQHTLRTHTPAYVK